MVSAQRINGSTDQRINRSTDQRVDGSIDQRIRRPPFDQNTHQPTSHQPASSHRLNVPPPHQPTTPHNTPPKDLAQKGAAPPRLVVTASPVHDPTSGGGNVGSLATLGDLSGLASGPKFNMVDGGAYDPDKAYKVRWGEVRCGVVR